jgi:Protein of unknown function (DUF3752)
MPSVGPELPPHLSKRKHFVDDEDDESPSPPTKIQAVSPPKERRILGPALPPAPLDQRPPQPADKSEDESSSDDDDYGPSLPPAPGSTAAYEAEVQLRAAEEAASERVKTAKPQREEWMLVPPKDSDWGSRVDPTKLKNRKFASGKGAKAPVEKSGISAIWTETPEQKRQRLEDEVMGRKDPSASAQSKKPRKDDAEAEATAKRIAEYNEKNRSQSLYEEHKKAVPREKEDDPSKRGFDKEKDMGLGGRIGHVQKQDMLKRAGDFGSRFERGSYL